MKEYVHKNGLTIKLPADFSAEETDEGFIVQPADGSNKSVRFPVEARVALLKDGKPTDGDEKRMQQKSVGNRTLKYRVEKLDGGSGGAEYDFFAYESVAGSSGYISYRQREQSENSEPAFNLVWQIIENTRIKN